MIFENSHAIYKPYLLKRSREIKLLGAICSESCACTRHYIGTKVFDKSSTCEYVWSIVKIGFFSEGDEGIQFVGDKRALQMLVQGLKHHGVESLLSCNPDLIASCDFVFLSNIIRDLKPRYHLLQMMGKPYGLINFHEDFIRYWGPCAAFYAAIEQCLEQERFPFTLPHLQDAPDHVLFFSPPPRKESLNNYEVIKNAKLCIANSPTESLTIKRDCPQAKVSTIFWGPGMLTQESYPEDLSFLKFSGLGRKTYILQVGRLAPNKNQLGTIIATKDLDIPLVLISNYAFFDDYNRACIRAALKWRRAPTYIFSSRLEPFEEGPVKVIRFSSQFDFSTRLLVSAYQNAALYLHPAFTELPGFVYLEAAKLGTPTIATEWTTLRDYFIDPKTGAYTLDGRIHYVKKPYDTVEIQNAVEMMLGQTFAPSSHPILHRTEKDMAADLLIDIKKIPLLNH